jgi:DNA topoisomerase-1
VSEAVRQTADRLGNTPAVARRSYVHPAVLDAYVDGEIPRRRSAPPADLADPAEEAEVVALLRRRLRDERRPPRAGRRG